MPDDGLGPEDLQDQRAELPPDREVLSLLTDPTSMQVPSLLGGAGAPAPANTVPTGGAYSPTATSTAG
jgi:hypothetical protein